MEGLKIIFRALILLLAILIVISGFRFTLNAKRAPTIHEAVYTNTQLIIGTTSYILEDIIIGGGRFIINNYVGPFMKGDFLGGLKAKLKRDSELQPESTDTTTPNI